jgi:hypothetical protein
VTYRGRFGIFILSYLSLAILPAAPFSAETGFTERIIRTHTTVFRDIAHVWVLYEGEMPGWNRPAQQGVDSFQLVRQERGWKIASITNELPTPDRPNPEVLRGEG